MGAQIISWPTNPRCVTRRSLSDQDCFTIAAGLHELPGGWFAQHDQLPDGTVCMALFADEDEPAPAFTVRRDAIGFLLEGSARQVLGHYEDADGVMYAMRCMLGA